MRVESLLSISIRAFAQFLQVAKFDSSSSIVHCLSALPELEVAKLVWLNFVRELQENCIDYQQGLDVATAFAFVFWQPKRLHVRIDQRNQFAVEGIQVVGTLLQHLELQGSLNSLSCFQCCSQLRCLCLRSCFCLLDADLETLPSFPALQALDLGGLSQLTDAATVHISRVSKLTQLNISDTVMTDRTVQMLTYGHQLRRWVLQHGSSNVPSGGEAWAPLPLSVLRGAGTLITAAGLPYLLDLPSILLLDLRRTSIRQAAMQPLKQRFALQIVQSALLTSSNVMAAAVVNHEVIACVCARQVADDPDIVEQWAEEGAQMMLHASPSRGVQSFLEKRAPLNAKEVLDPSAAGAYSNKKLLQRKRGYRVNQQKEGRLRSTYARQDKGQNLQSPMHPAHEHSRAWRGQMQPWQAGHLQHARDS